MSLEDDKNFIWHPLTQHQLYPEHLLIKKAKGVILYDDHDNEYIDGIASWYTCMYGHCNPSITKKVAYTNVRIGPLSFFTGFTHKTGN